MTPHLTCAAAAAMLLVGGTRHADIVDEPDSSVVKPNPELDAGDIPELDSGLGTDAHPACADRV